MRVSRSQGERHASLCAAALALCVALLVASCSASTTTAVSEGPTTTATASTANAIRPEDHRPDEVPGRHRRRREGAPGAGRAGTAAHPAGNLHRQGRHHRAGHADTAGGGHPLPDRLEHQDHDGRADRAARPGRQAPVQRPCVHLRPRCAQRQQHHHRRAVEDAQRALQLHASSRVLGRAGRRPDEGLDPAGGAGHRVPPAAGVPARHVLRLQQHQLRAAGSGRREGRRAAAAPAVRGPTVRPAWAGADFASGRGRQLHPGSVLARLHVRGTRPTRWSTIRIPPICRPPPGPER